MSFLTESDYSAQIRSEILNTVKNTNGLSKAELMAQTEMESYLNSRYDVSQIFNKEGDQRNSLILMYLIDITLYHLHSNISPRNVPELRAIRYEAAIDWLNRVAAGKLNPDLPELPDQGGTDYFFLGGSNQKYSQGW
ncbi:phage protein Gp36 family protein [Sphingobacterium spiritivorum]|uniref:phage protein Gp36 family protein n=1 Tax=Sphingobacterium spiritivorum TaxID=258 RepID=UPI003DA48EC1